MRRDWGWDEDTTYLVHMICVQGGRARGRERERERISSRVGAEHGAQYGT